MRTERIKIRVTPEQKAALKTRSDTHGVSVSDFVRFLVLDPDSLRKFPDRDLMVQLIAQLRGIGTNINQYQTALNEGLLNGSVEFADFQRMQAAILDGVTSWGEHHDQLNAMIKRMSQ